MQPDCNGNGPQTETHTLMVALAYSLVLLALAAWMAFGRYPVSAANVFFCGAWGMMLLLYRVFGYDYEYLLWVIAFTIACVSAWIAGELLVSWAYRREHAMARRSVRTFEIRFLPEFLMAMTAIGMIAPFDWAATTGIHLSEITNVGALLDAAQTAHLALAQQRVEQSMVNKICLLFALAGVVMSGIHLGIGKSKRKVPLWLLMAPVMPYLSMMLLTTLRSMMVMPVVMMFAGWIAGLALTDRDRSIFEPKRLSRIAGAVLVMIVIIVYLQGVRNGDYTFSRIDQTIVHLRIWTAGYEPALVNYMRQVWDHQLKWGSSTFRVITGLFGSDDGQLVYGSGQVDIGMGETSNAMTALRFFLEDWGMSGAVIFCLLWGALTGYVGEVVRTGKLWLSPILALLVAVAIFSPNSWFLNYGTRCFAPLVAVAYLLVCGKVTVVDRGWQRPTRKRRSAKASKEDANRAAAAQALGLHEKRSTQA